MFLKSMEMFGVKSFADRTRINFEPGVTIIVGPNGCGKSNVVDAIKWVLGEKQARNIRGEKMEDIIFAGTEQRKQLSLSEVFVTIDNTGKVLDIDADQVTVGRRIFRDGESEYSINKASVRLKDVESLFLDTGIGKSAYSVMEQGKIDMILSTRAEDRRYIFEEAAGISKYKLQKRESLKKLADTSDNLDRINDIIKEIEREKESKSMQVETTKAYLVLKNELGALEVTINATRFRELASKRMQIQGEVEKHQRARAEVSARIAATSAANEKDEKRKNDIQQQLFELEKRLHAYRIRVEDIDERAERNRSLINEELALKQGIEDKITERRANLSRLAEERDRSSQSGVQIASRIEDDRRKLESFFATRTRKTGSIEQSREAIEERKAGIKKAEVRLKELQASLELVIKRLIDAIEKRKAELEGSEKERIEVRTSINAAIESIGESLRRAAADIREGRAADALALIESVDLARLNADLQRFEGYEDGFRSILFDKTGVHAEKENLDGQIRSAAGSIEQYRAEIASLEAHIRNEQVELEDVNQMITRIEKDLSRNENERDWIDKHVLSLGSQILDLENQIGHYGEEILRADKKIESLTAEIEEWERRLIEFNERSSSLMEGISDMTEKRRELEVSIRERKDAARGHEDELRRIVEKITALDKTLVEVDFKKNGIEEYLWIEHEKKIDDALKGAAGASDLEGLLERSGEIKKRIQELGPINNLAIEEYRNLEKRLEYYTGQRNDIRNARDDIYTVIEDINRTSVEMFMDTFRSIQKNFSEIFRQLFEGGNAAIELVDPENVLESGIEILIRPPGKKLKYINLLSGGERALTAIALLFATYMVKPSPFCFLDEIDAALDEQNVGRFVRLLREFTRGSQFVIVTHNKKTMTIGETLYGVTMEEPGISKLVSLRMNKPGGESS
jgi:chromosome segregation protein